MKPTQQITIENLIFIKGEIPNFFGTSDQVNNAVDLINDAINLLTGSVK